MIRRRKPTIEDVLELAGIETLHPGGLDIPQRIGDEVGIAGLNVLDVACGWGTLPCCDAQRQAACVLGVDISAAVVARTIRKVRECQVEDRVEVVRRADALHLHFLDGTFDIVVNKCAVGLTADPRQCMAEMVRVTRPGERSSCMRTRCWSPCPRRRRPKLQHSWEPIHGPSRSGER